jgi:hypothetical protein
MTKEELASLIRNFLQSEVRTIKKLLRAYRNANNAFTEKDLLVAVRMLAFNEELIISQVRVLKKTVKIVVVNLIKENVTMDIVLDTEEYNYKLVTHTRTTRDLTIQELDEKYKSIYETKHKQYGLKLRHRGCKFDINSKTYTIVSITERKVKQPIICKKEGDDEHIYKLGLELVINKLKETKQW